MDFRNVLLVFSFLVLCSGTPTPQIDLSKLSNNINKQKLVQYRLVNGTVIPERDYPYMVAITQGFWILKDFLCGGSLISESTVLTAAHCIDAMVNKDGILRKSIRVVVGANNWETEGTRYKVERYVRHPDYDVSQMKNDISLLITTTKVELSDSVKLVTLNYDYVGARVRTIVTGWGQKDENSSYSIDLRAITIPTISGDKCKEIFENLRSNKSGYPVYPNLEICTYDSPGIGTCMHDSGSPMIRSDNHEQIGIVSWGERCAIGFPDIFARISVYKEFIKANIVE